LFTEDDHHDYAEEQVWLPDRPNKKNKKFRKPEQGEDTLFMSTKKEKKGFRCCVKFQEKVKRDGNGERWLRCLLLFQILYFIVYNILNYFNNGSAHSFISYELFITLMIFWMIIGAVLFLNNVTHYLKVGELIPFTVCVLAINVYIISKMIITGIMIYNLRMDDQKNIQTSDIMFVL
jgi:hypothetical protein